MSRLLTSEEVPYFRKLIDHYQLHESVLEQFRKNNYTVIAGPAGAGKDTLRDNLIQKFPEKYLPVLSTVTRPPRTGEIDGVTYHFREIEEVKQGLLEHKYFQTELVHSQQIACLEIYEITKLAQDQWGLSIMVVESEKKLRQIKSDIKTIFLIPPDTKTLIARLKGERTLKSEEIKRRLSAAKHEIAYAETNQDYYCLISDTVEHVVDRAHSFLQNNERNESDDKKARQTMKKIVEELTND